MQSVAQGDTQRMGQLWPLKLPNTFCERGETVDTGEEELPLETFLLALEWVYDTSEQDRSTPLIGLQ